MLKGLPKFVLQLGQSLFSGSPGKFLPLHDETQRGDEHEIPCARHDRARSREKQVGKGIAQDTESQLI
jgi:hypothetical protein